MHGVLQYFHFHITLRFPHEIWWCKNNAKVSVEMEENPKTHKSKNPKLDSAN